MPILIELTRILAAAQWNKQDFKYNYVALTDDANETAQRIASKMGIKESLFRL